MSKLHIPADVPLKSEKAFIENYQVITHKTNRLFLFACDQKIEHLHDDFDPDDEMIDEAAIHPEHLFRIASQGTIGAMATQLALISRYAKNYPDVHYIAKLNSKTNLPKDIDPNSAQLWDVHQAISLQKNGVNIRGIGVTIYPGSEFENDMLEFASQSIFHAHQHGLIAILWMYPRGKHIKNDTDIDLLAGVAGMANALGADFVKIKAPKNKPEALQEVVAAAGNTKVIISGGEQQKTENYLEHIYAYIHQGGVAGTATGRNIFQHNLQDAIKITQAISTIVYKNTSLYQAKKLLKSNK